jgi:hypothetical protein
LTRRAAPGNIGADGRLAEPGGTAVITCYLRYTIDPYKRDAFERYSRMILPLAAQYGGVHHGAFLPHEGPNNIAVHLFSFPSLAEYERYRTLVRDDEVAKAAWRLAEETRCIVSFERSFMRPVFADQIATTPQDPG